MTLLESVADWVISRLPHNKSDANAVAELRQKHPGELLALYFNWTERLVPAEPRQVMRSMEIVNNTMSINHKSVVDEIINDIEKGSTLTKYLSDRVCCGFDLPKKRKKKDLKQFEHLDLLLNEWGIYHFHLSTQVTPSGFVERGNPLLFLMFRPSKAYFLDIKTHFDFEDEALARIAISNWPNDNLFRQLEGIKGHRDSNPYTTSDRKALRKAGIASFIQIDGNIFIPAKGGITNAGISVQSVRSANHIMRELKQFEDRISKDNTEIIKFINKHGGTSGEILQFKFEWFRNGFGVIETTSGVPIGFQN